MAFKQPTVISATCIISVLSRFSVINPEVRDCIHYYFVWKCNISRVESSLRKTVMKVKTICSCFLQGDKYLEFAIQCLVSEQYGSGVNTAGHLEKRKDHN